MGITRNPVFQVRALNDEDKTKEQLLHELSDLRQKYEEREKAELEHNQMEESLKIISRQNELILNSTGEGIFGLDTEGQHTYVNMAAARMLGYTADELLGKKSHSCWHHTKENGSPYPEDDCPIYKAYRKGVAFHNVRDEVFWRKDGTNFPVAYTSTPIFEDNRIVGAVVIFMDITERRKAEEALKRNEENFRRLIDRNPVAMAVATKNGEFISFNNKFVETFGYTLHDIHTVNDWWPLAYPDEEYRQQVMNSWRMAAARARKEGGETETRVWRVTCKDGSVRDIEFKMTSLQDINIVIFQDITDRKKAEESLRESNNELERAHNNLKLAQSQILQQEKMAGIGQLAAGVAHEINNPIGFIMSNLYTLRKYTEKLNRFIAMQAETIKELSQSGKNAESLMSRINGVKQSLKVDYIAGDIISLINESSDGAQRVKKIVQDLKSFSRIDEAECKMTNINEGIESTISMVWNELKYKVILKKEYGPIPHTKCNLGQLNQVVMNLLINAAQAIEKQGEIEVRTWSDDGNIYIAISDTGVGIPEDKISKIFEPFYTTKDVGKGTGLGLSIAYDIVKKHNGDLTVQSETGKGTLFTIRIPIII